MTNKKFIFFFFLGSLLIFSILPIFNYTNDQWRVLHKDYNNYYEGIEPNKHYLKIAYLLENKNTYHAFAFGSSRLGNIDLRNHFKNMYNMTYSKGHINSHLENLKTLLDNGIKIKQVLLGIDDFFIYDAGEFENDYLRRSYKNSIVDKIDFYKFYLFKKPQKRDFDIFFNKYKLIPSPQIVNPNNITINKEMEQKVSNDPNHVKSLSNTLVEPIKNQNFSTNLILDKIREFKDICDKNNIDLVIYFNPAYYKLYLSYDQNEIERFKKELVTISSFHDFYRLDPYTLDEKFWFDLVHFIPIKGNELMIKLKSNKYLVTKDTISEDLKNVRKSIKNIIEKDEDNIILLNQNINLSALEKEFISGIQSLKNKTYDKNSIVSFNIISSVACNFTLKNSNQELFSVAISKGDNKFKLLIPSKYLNSTFDIILDTNAYNYTLKDLILYK